MSQPEINPNARAVADNEVRLTAVGAAVSVAVNIAVTAVSWSVGKRYGHPWIGGLVGFFLLSPPIAGATYSIVTGKLRPSMAPTPQRDILRDAAARDGLPVVAEGVRATVPARVAP